MDWNLFNQELRNVIDTGAIEYGTKKVKKECLVGEPKLIIVSSTIAPYYKEQLEYYAKLLDIQIIEYPESSLELGSVCAKPFGISTVAIKDFGQSSIIEAINAKKEDGNKENARVKAKREKKEVKKKKADDKKAKLLEKKKEAMAAKGEVDEDSDVPLTEDKFFKDMIKIKKK